MAKIFDPNIVNPMLTGFIEELVIKQGNLPVSKPFEVATKPIDEYEGHMRVNAAEKFDVVGYVATINFYASKSDAQAARMPKGALVLYLDSEIADKIFKAAGLQVPYDEDDESMMALSGQLCQLIANALKERLAADGYVTLETSAPAVYKNTIPHGVAFSSDQTEKQEIAFYFFKHKALVIDWTMGPLSRR